jgi:hypothetical protein
MHFYFDSSVPVWHKCQQDLFSVSPYALKIWASKISIFVSLKRKDKRREFTKKKSGLPKGAAGS